MNEAENFLRGKSALTRQNMGELPHFSLNIPFNEIDDSNQINQGFLASTIVTADAQISDWQVNRSRWEKESLDRFDDDVLLSNSSFSSRSDSSKQLPNNRSLDELTGLTSSLSNPQKFGNIDDKNKKLRLTDEFGVKVTFTLKGNGYGEVVGENNFERVILHDTDENSKLIIRTLGKNTQTSVGEIIVNDSLDKLIARTTDLTGDIEIGGITTKIVLDDVIGVNSTFKIDNKNNHPPNTKANIILDRVENLNLYSQQAIDRLKASEWLDTDTNRENIVAPTIEYLKIKKDLQANLHITGTNRKDKKVLKQVAINGVVEGVWQIEGNTGMAVINDTSDEWFASFDNQIIHLKIKKDLRGVLAFSNSAENTYIEVGGNILNATILSGADLGNDNRVGGVGENVDTYSDGSIERIKVFGNVVSSVIGAGLNPVDEIFNNGNDTIEGRASSLFDRFSVKGNVSSDSSIAAGEFNRVKINRLGIDVEEDDRFLTPEKIKVVLPGEELDLTSLSIDREIETILSDINLDLNTDRYKGQIKIINHGETIDPQVAIVIKDLPAGVELINASGIDRDGNPYLNLDDAIVSDGLDTGKSSANVVMEFFNPNNLPLDFVTQVLTKKTNSNSPPVWETIAPLSVRAGDKLSVPLLVTDADGDEVAFWIENLDNLPIEMLIEDDNLVLNPQANAIGTYNFDLIATDGLKDVVQTVTLDVLANPHDTVTSISGFVLDTEGLPLVGVPIKLGGINTLTSTDGSFTLEIPEELLPTHSMNIEIPKGDIYFDPQATGDRTIDMHRAGYDTSTGTDIDNPRRHPNLISSFLDGSAIYGSDLSRANALRTFDGTGKLKTSPGNLLPFNTLEYFPEGILENDSAGHVDPQSLFVAGDVRGSENPALAALHTLFVREHNSLTEQIRQDRPLLTGEEIYQQARKLVIALIQKITYDEYLPQLLGTQLSPYTGYDSSIDPMISTLFNTTAFRIGHSQSTAEVIAVNAGGEETALTIAANFFNTAPLIDDGIDSILRGVARQQAQLVDTKVIDSLRNFLFGIPGAGGLDLVSLGIQRGRDLGLPSYNQARVDMGLSPVTSFNEISSNPDVQTVLASTYDSVDDIDPWVGGLAEDHVSGGIIGSLFTAIITDQFIRLRDGDRFWYENGQLTATELAWIENNTLGSTIERNTNITGLTGSVFNTNGNSAVPIQKGLVITGDTDEIRSYDGWGNNLNNPHLGSRGENLRLGFTLDYEDGISAPAGSTRPSARTISNQVFAQDEDILAGGASLMVVFWGQLIAHDLTLTPTGISNTLEIYGNNLSNNGEVTYPFVAQKLPSILGSELSKGTDNQIDRPIYLSPSNK